MGIQRVTTPLLLVVDALSREPQEEHYAYAMSKMTGLPPGSVQPILTRLESAGWLTARWEKIDPRVEGRRPRRLYAVTAFGGREMAGLLHEHSHRLRGFRTRPAPGGSPA
jgi:PadR family transcriptional regulator PadR